MSWTFKYFLKCLLKLKAKSMLLTLLAFLFIFSTFATKNFLYMIPLRLFDIVLNRKNDIATNKCVSEKIGDKWIDFSYQEVYGKSINFAKALIANNISKGDKIAIISTNNPYWNFIDIAAQLIGAIIVPIYPTSSSIDIEFILNDSESKIVFCKGLDILNKLNLIKGSCTNLKKIISIDNLTDSTSLEDFLKIDKNIDTQIILDLSSSILPNDLLTIIYTSGTTGFPKGVMLSHRNILFQIENITDIPIKEGDKVLSFLPLSHIFERAVFFLYLYKGVHVSYIPDITKLREGLNEVKPVFITCVPRLLEKIYEGLITKGNELNLFQRIIYFSAFKYAKKFNGRKGLRYYIFNKLIFSKWREALGNNLKNIVTGAAALQIRLGYFFDAIGINVREGYGMTETSPVISYNRFNNIDYKFGSVGKILENVQLKLDNRPGMDPQEGEITIKGDNIMLGYYKNKEETDKIIKNGWLHTGDIGKIDANGFLFITDRIKELIKTSGGKYIAPQRIENKVKESKYIEQVMVVGENKKFVSALIFPSITNFKYWSNIKGLDINFEDSSWTKNEWVYKKIYKIVSHYNEEFSQVEKIKKIFIIPNEWTIENGELTPTLKLKRKVILNNWKKEIDSMYD